MSILSCVIGQKKFWLSSYSIALALFLAIPHVVAAQKDFSPWPSELITPPINHIWSLVFKTPGEIAVYEGHACEKGPRRVRWLHMSLDVDPEYTHGTVIHNGWRLKYLSDDHHVEQLASFIPYVRFQPGKLEWLADGWLGDEGFDDPYEWCHYYIALAWNAAFIDMATLPAATSPSPIGTYSLSYSSDRPTKSVKMSRPNAISSHGLPGNKVVLPAGIYYFWHDDDHHLLHAAYQYEHWGETYGDWSWFGEALWQDNKEWRKYNLVEYVRGVAGTQIAVKQDPLLHIMPSKGSSWNAGCITRPGRLETTQVTVDRLPFDYAIPVLAGWDLRFDCDDQHVAEIGVWIHDVSYVKRPGAPGALHYYVSRILRDEDSDPRFFSAYRVNILGISRSVWPQLPDWLLDMLMRIIFYRLR